MYLDSLNLCNVSVMHTHTPRAAILSHRELKKIHNTDVIVRGKIHLDTYKFGKLPVCSQFSFSMFVIIPPFFHHAKCEPLTYLQESFCEPLARGSPIRRFDGDARGSPLRRVHGAARVSAGGFSCEAYDDHNFFVQVDELLDRVTNLTSHLPTSGSRMRNIAGLFTPGKGPSEEEIDAAHNFDCGQFLFLKMSVTNVRSSFVQFKHSKDDKCA